MPCRPVNLRAFTAASRVAAGAVIIWDEGTAEIVREEPGHISFVLHGRKLSGGFALSRTRERRWILVKVRDEDARPGSDIVTENGQRPESLDLAGTARSVGASPRGARGHRPPSAVQSGDPSARPDPQPGLT